MLNAGTSGVQDQDGLIFIAHGDTVPGAGINGYAPGCLFIDTDSNTLYINLGTALSCDFDQIGGPGPTDIQTTGDAATIGDQLLTNSEFTSDIANWTIGGTGSGWSWVSGAAAHTAGNTDPFSAAVATTSGVNYYIIASVTNVSAGSVVLTFGSGAETHTFTASSTYYRSIMAGSTGANTIVFTPSSDFNGRLAYVRVYAITGATTTTLRVNDATGATTGFQVRSGGAATSFIAPGNIFIGELAGVYCYPRTSAAGINNVALGYAALASVTTGSSNVALNSQSLYSCTTGSNNMAMGHISAYSLTIGDQNVCLGDACMTGNETGSYNAALGSMALAAMSSGSYNVAVGQGAGRYYGAGTDNMTTPDNSIFVGYDSRGGAADNSNCIVIGVSAVGLGSNTIVIGNASTVTAQLRGAHRLDNVAAPTATANAAYLYAADQTAGNSCIHVLTENNATLKLYQGAAIANATDAASVIARLNDLLAHLRLMGVIAT